MKKILISIIGVIILILICVATFKGISIGKVAIYSVKQIKADSEKLDATIAEANTEINQNYAKSLADIDTAINNLKTAKEEYETKVSALTQNPEIGITQIQKYKSEYLWVIIGRYATNENLRIDLEIQETSIQDTYNIKFTLQGSYVGITNFLYNIENDDELNYKVKDFKIEPTTTTTESTSGNAITTSNTEKLIATFVVENVIIIN